MTDPIKTWYVLVRENPPSSQPPGLTPKQIENNRNLPILVHWDRSQLQEANGYYIIPVQTIAPLK